MMLFETLIAYIVFLTICSTSDTQNTDLKTAINITKNTSNKCAEESEGNFQRKGRDSSPGNKQGIGAKSINLGLIPSPQLKAQMSMPKTKSTQIPLNFVIDTKPRTIPNKIPFVLKTANAMPVPGHYVRLKADPDRKRSYCPKIDINLGLKKVPPRSKVTPKDKVTPKPITTRKNNLKRVNFFEDDTNIESLPPAPKQPVTRKNKRPENKNDSSHSEQDNDHNNDVVHIKNATHLIRISKLPQHSDGHETHKGPSAGHHIKKPQEEISHDNRPIDTLDEFKQPVIPTQEEVTVAMFINSDGINDLNAQPENKIEVLKPREPPIIARNIEDDPQDVITITNRNYEEVEERSGAYPEANNFIEDDPPLATPAWNTAPTNPYNNYLQNYQNTYDQYLKYIAETNPNMYKKGNCYPRVADSEETTDYSQTLPLTSEGQAVQDVFYGLKPDGLNNIIDVRPENNLGRIWRTWKDTEIRISKPTFFNNKPADCGRNFNDLNFGEIIAKAPSRPLFGTPAIGLNGYYDNLNNPLPYPYSYQPYRYVL